MALELFWSNYPISQPQMMLLRPQKSRLLFYKASQQQQFQTGSSTHKQAITKCSITPKYAQITPTGSNYPQFKNTALNDEAFHMKVQVHTVFHSHIFSSVQYFYTTSGKNTFPFMSLNHRTCLWSVEKTKYLTNDRNR